MRSVERLALFATWALILFVPDPTSVAGLAAVTPQISQAVFDDDVPAGVAERATAAVSIQAGSTRWQGFFVGPGLVVTSAVPLAGRTVVQLVTGSGRAGLGQVVATDGEARLAVLRVHADLTPPVFVDVGAPASGLVGARGFLLRHDGRGAPEAERVVLGAPRTMSGMTVAELSSDLATDAAGAPCVDARGRLLGVVTFVDAPSGPSGLALVGDRVRALVTDAARRMEAPPKTAASRTSAPPGRTAAASDREVEVESDMERQRRLGAEAFERAVSRLVGQRDGVTKLQARYDVECVGTYVPIVTVPGVAWPYAGGFAIEKSELPECKALKDQLDSRAVALRRGLADAEEQARRAGVYPGTLRDIKRAYGLEAIH